MATALALLAGVVVYGLLTVAYDTFYAELGLTPADVGVQYGSSIGGAAALTVVVFLITAGLGTALWLGLTRPILTNMTTASPTRAVIVGLMLAGALVVLAAFLIDDSALLVAGWAVVAVLLGGGVAHVVKLSSGATPGACVSPATDDAPVSGDPARPSATQTGAKGISEVNRNHVAAAYAVVCSVGVAWLVLTTWVAHVANEHADRVKEGLWVQPPDNSGLVFFSVRAMPVTHLEAMAGEGTSKSAPGEEASTRARVPTDAAFAEERDKNRLLYLGTANGQLVLYDYDTQESLVLPTTAFRVTVLNCETDRIGGKSNIRDFECEKPPDPPSGSPSSPRH